MAIERVAAFFRRSEANPQIALPFGLEFRPGLTPMTQDELNRQVIYQLESLSNQGGLFSRGTIIEVDLSELGKKDVAIIPIVQEQSHTKDFMRPSRHQIIAVIVYDNQAQLDAWLEARVTDDILEVELIEGQIPDNANPETYLFSLFTLWHEQEKTKQIQTLESRAETLLLPRPIVDEIINIAAGATVTTYPTSDLRARYTATVEGALAKHPAYILLEQIWQINQAVAAGNLDGLAPKVLGNMPAHLVKHYIEIFMSHQLPIPPILNKTFMLYYQQLNQEILRLSKQIWGLSGELGKYIDLAALGVYLTANGQGILADVNAMASMTTGVGSIQLWRFIKRMQQTLAEQKNSTQPWDQTMLKLIKPHDERQAETRVDRQSTNSWQLLTPEETQAFIAASSQKLKELLIIRQNQILQTDLLLLKPDNHAEAYIFILIPQKKPKLIIIRDREILTALNLQSLEVLDSAIPLTAKDDRAMTTVFTRVYTSEKEEK